MTLRHTSSFNRFLADAVTKTAFRAKSILLCVLDLVEKTKRCKLVGLIYICMHFRVKIFMLCEKSIIDFVFCTRLSTQSRILFALKEVYLNLHTSFGEQSIILCVLKLVSLNIFTLKCILPRLLHSTMKRFTWGCFPPNFSFDNSLNFLIF